MNLALRAFLRAYFSN